MLLDVNNPNDPNFNEMCVSHTLFQCRYFKEDKIAMEALVQGFGNIILFGAKVHLEINIASLENVIGTSSRNISEEKYASIKACGEGCMCFYEACDS